MNKVPPEAWTCMNHSVSHLKVFCCVAYAHILDELRKKLGNKGQKCIFVGYFEDTKTYKLYDPVTRKVIMYGVSLVSRFMESPKYSHWKVDKRILRHVRGRKDVGIMYST